MANLEAPGLPAAPATPTVYLLLPLEADLILQPSRKLTQQKQNQSTTYKHCADDFFLFSWVSMLN